MARPAANGVGTSAPVAVGRTIGSRTRAVRNRAYRAGMTVSTQAPVTVLDFDALYDALDDRRVERGLGWYELADLLWEQSADLNARRTDDHPLCGGAVKRLRSRGATSCQYALYLLRWLDRAPEDFLAGPARHVGDTRLPAAGPGHRLRWDLAALHAALQDRRTSDGLTWAGVATELGCTPARLTNLRTARLADLDLVVRATQWLGRPAADFIHPAEW